MAKLIGHYFDGERGYILFEVDGLKETPKQYAKVHGQTTETKPGGVYDYWNIIPKADLGRLRAGFSERFTMYGLQEDMPRFKALVIEELRKRAESAEREYDSAVALYAAAGGEIEESAAGIINKDFYGLTPEEYDKTIAGLSGLSLIVAPLIMQTEQGGVEQAAEFSLDMQIAADAVRELKQQVHGIDSLTISVTPDGVEGGL